MGCRVIRTEPLTACDARGILKQIRADAKGERIMVATIDDARGQEMRITENKYIIS